MKHEIDCIGKAFGRLTILGEMPSKKGHRQVLCACACGNKTEKRLSSVKAGLTKSCGCLYMDREDYIGKIFNRLTVVDELPVRDGVRRVKCSCKCGKETDVRLCHLKDGGVKSCGCLVREAAKKLMTKHGKGRSSEYSIRQGMIQRCHNKKAHAYEAYGGRGITVCDRWLESFEHFYADMGDKPEGLTLDRIDNNKGYSPDNCRWATCKEQARNTRRTRLNVQAVKVIKYLLDKGCKSIAQISEAYRVSPTTISDIKYSRTWSEV